MTKKRGFKIISFIITTLIFGGIAYYLYLSINNGNLFLDNSKSFLVETVIIFAPLVLTIIWSIIEKRKAWIGGVAIIVMCTFLNYLVGDKVTRNHIPLYILCIAIPYICCLYAIFASKRTTSYSSSSYSYSSSSDDYYSGSSYSGSSSSSYDDCGAYGYPAEMGANYHPDHIPMDLSDM